MTFGTSRTRMDRREALPFLCTGLYGAVSGCNATSETERATFSIESARAYEVSDTEVVSVVELGWDQSEESNVALRWEVDTGEYRTATEQEFVIPADVPNPRVSLPLTVSDSVALSDAPSSRVKILRDGTADPDWVDVEYRGE